MGKVKSFDVDHRSLDEGVYLRHCIKVLGIVPLKVWDVRFVAPRDRHKIGAKGSHVLEHIFAKKLRDTKIGRKIISVNMMGCGTGMYVETLGKVSVDDVIQALDEVLQNSYPIENAEEIPAMNEIQCGNPLFRSIPEANKGFEYLSHMLIKYKK